MSDLNSKGVKISNQVRFCIDNDIYIGEVVQINDDNVDIITYMGMIKGIPINILNEVN
jgi:hypothetical protein